MQNTYKIDLLFAIMIKKQISKWMNLVQPFQYSNANSLAKQIMLEGRKDTLIGEGNSRNVYSLGSYEAGGQEHHAVLKQYKKPANFHKVGFEALWMAVASNCFSEIIVPNFTFISYVQDCAGNKIFNLITEDISQGGKYKVQELEPEKLLPFDTGKRYQIKVRELIDYQFNIISSFDVKSIYSLARRGEESKDAILKSTGLAVHDGNDLQAIIVADVDQLYPFCKNYDSSMLLSLDDITFQLYPTP